MMNKIGEYGNAKGKIFQFLGKLVNKFKTKNFHRFKEISSIINTAQASGFKINTENDKFILTKQNRPIYLRKTGSDLSVFKQVFIDNEYGPLIQLIKDNDIEISFIIDAGSNIGLTSLKMFDNFTNAKIICVEPDETNYAMLSLNLSSFITNEKCFALQNALWSCERPLTLTNDFRDGEEWSRSVSTSVNNNYINKVQSTTINTLTSKFDIEIISILKLDIEGSETEIFSKNNNQDFLKIVKIIALEIHDEVADRQEIYEVLRKYDFFLFNSGELTIGVNRNLTPGWQLK